ncbi:arylamine N-acetyltransferase [Jeotgalibacillus sp. S-D1]|uniref:arylamine N-acetyltransferase family protein n=1 Tax=Jeotgalibacillus sp. S-D1 TaxID=2552189 RepID=UPI00105A36FF|nr:arylamine N-acetyltransferase [Jeotgalibacillus sp. S-D1]TDL34953.1 arylamine N-acetyltransferase [Jeotgalibacillus sp. S-D1]
MTELDRLFRQRIGFSEKVEITVETLHELLEKTANSIPFENLAIIRNKTKEISRENLIEKMLINNQGGLCYELNGLLCLFLIENNLDAALVRGVVYNNETKNWHSLGRTHVAIILTLGERMYLLDAGFGTNLPLKPLPLSGETVSSASGEFRIIKAEHEFGDYVLEMKLKHKDNIWKTGYIFNSKQFVHGLSEFNEIQQLLMVREESSFNKAPLITQIASNGHKILTNTSFTQNVNGIIQKEEIDEEDFNILASKYFGLNSSLR